MNRSKVRLGTRLALHNDTVNNLPRRDRIAQSEEVASYHAANAARDFANVVQAGHPGSTWHRQANW